MAASVASCQGISPQSAVEDFQRTSRGEFQAAIYPNRDPTSKSNNHHHEPSSLINNRSITSPPDEPQHFPTVNDGSEATRPVSSRYSLLSGPVNHPFPLHLLPTQDSFKAAARAIFKAYQ